MNELFFSGTRNTGDILLYDVRQKDCIIKFQHHRQEVCGLKWCPNGRYLASGSNDNTVCVWDFHQWHSSGALRTSTSSNQLGLASLVPSAHQEDEQYQQKKFDTTTTPLWQFKDHRAAVKVNEEKSIVIDSFISRLLLGVHGKVRKYWQQVEDIQMDIYVSGIITMELVNKPFKQNLK